MLSLGGARDPAEFTRRLAITTALLVAYRLGTFVPLPGIDPAALKQLGGVAERISIFALGITPYITILILAELLKVAAPSVRRWEQANTGNRITLNRIVVGLSLLAAAAQASGLSLALEDVTRLVEEPGTPFRLTIIVTLVASTAVVIWLADQITRHGLGSGVWLLFILPWIADVLPRFAALAVWQHDATLVIMELIIGCGLAAAMIAAVVALVRTSSDTLAASAVSLWSLLLADSLWPWLMVIIAFVMGGGSLQGASPWLSPANPILLLVFAGLVVVFVHLYVRSLHLANAAAVPLVPVAVFGVALAVLKLVELALALQLGWLVPLAGHLIIVTVVALSLLARWWQPPFKSNGEAD